MIKYRLSEYGKHTDFTELSEAVKHCESKNITDGEHGRLWLMVKNRGAGYEWLKANRELYIDKYMILSYTRRGNIYIWDEDSNNWYESEMYWELCRRMGEILTEVANNIEI
jgi:hypothetical protein